MMTGILAFLVDCIIGDPKSSWHPVVLMGKMISYWERLFYHPEDKDSRKFAWGAVLVLLVLWLTYAVAEGIMLLSYKIPWSFGSTAVGAVMLSFAISPKSLAKAGKELYGHPGLLLQDKFHSQESQPEHSSCLPAPFPFRPIQRRHQQYIQF